MKSVPSQPFEQVQENSVNSQKWGVVLVKKCNGGALNLLFFSFLNNRESKNGGC